MSNGVKFESITIMIPMDFGINRARLICVGPTTSMFVDDCEKIYINQSYGNTAEINTSTSLNGTLKNKIYRAKQIKVISNLIPEIDIKQVSKRGLLSFIFTYHAIHDIPGSGSSIQYSVQINQDKFVVFNGLVK